MSPVLPQQLEYTARRPGSNDQIGSFEQPAERRKVGDEQALNEGF